MILKAIDTKPSGDELIRLIIAGDAAAFSEYVKQRARYYYNVAYRVALNRQAAEDAVQNAFVTLWEKRKELKKDGNINAWLYRVVVNKAIDDKRRIKFVELDERHPDSNDEEEGHIKNQEAVTVQKSLEALPPRQRAAIMMVYFDEIPQKEAAENMGIGLKAFESLLSRAKVILKEKLNERDKTSIQQIGNSVSIK